MKPSPWPYPSFLETARVWVTCLRACKMFLLKKSFNRFCYFCLAFFIFLFFSTSLSLAQSSGRFTRVRQKSSVTRSCQCVQTLVRLPVFRFFNVRTAVLACTKGTVRGHSKTVCIGRWFWEKNPLPHRGLEPASVLRPAFSVGRSTSWAIPAS